MHKKLIQIKSENIFLDLFYYLELKSKRKKQLVRILISKLDYEITLLGQVFRNSFN